MSEDNELLYEILINDNYGASNKVASALNIAYRTVHEYCCNPNRNIPIRVWKTVFLITGDPRAKKKLEPSGYELRPVVAGDPEASMDKEMGDAIIAINAIWSKYRDALADAKISKAELLELESCFVSLDKEIADIKALVRLAREKSRAAA